VKTLHYLFTTILLLATASSSYAEDFNAPLARLDLKSGDSIVFLGDSITHQCLYTQYVEDYVYMRQSKLRVKFHNAGVGGAKAWDALQRFDEDVAKYKPKYVTVLLGMNDGRYTPYNEEIFRTYHKDMTELIGRIADSGATPILMTPTMFDSRAARMGRRQHDPGKLELYNSVLAYYGTWLREVAVRNGYGFVDMYSPLNNLTLAQRKTDPKFTMIRDAVHPDPPGQLVMATAIIDALGLRRPLAHIRVKYAMDGSSTTSGFGGQLTDVKVSDERVEFTWLADALPFVVPEEARSGEKLLRLGRHPQRNGLEANGLKPGQYELTIDGQSVGVYSYITLSWKIPLQENTNTPQYQQAAKIAELNKQRNAGPVRSMRNEWRTFQQYARLAEQLKSTPDNVGLQKQVEALKKKLDGLDERVAMHKAAADEIENQIYTMNRPKPRKFVLRRVEPTPVSGTITLDGRPAVGLKVKFQSENGRKFEATTNEDGRYQIKPTDGALPGTYEVIIQPVESDNKADDDDDDSAASNAGIPSGLIVQISGESGNEFDFDLKTN